MREKHRAVKEAAEYLDQIPKFTKRKHTREELLRMLFLLGVREEKMRILHVAGTNGKGSVCAFLDFILREAGYHTAVFTSPHLVSIKERFSFDGTDASDLQFLQAFEAVKSSISVFEKEGLGHPSYFEYLFFMFMVMASKAAPDYVILETGLGGRLDATNCVSHPEATIITSISLDHMEYLGNTVEEIAGEKAGILKAGVPVIYDNTSEPASRVIAKRAESLGCPAWPVDRHAYESAVLEGDGLLVSVAAEEEGTSLALQIPFAAGYQAVNAMLAFRTAKLLGIEESIIGRGLQKTKWPGRMEEILPHVYLDGAHNEGGIREFVRAAKAIADGREMQENGRKILLFGVASDKEYETMAKALQDGFSPDVWILTKVRYSRGLELSKLEGAVRRAVCGMEGNDPDIRILPDTEAAFSQAMAEQRPEDTVFCAGSLYLIGEIKEMLRRKENE